MLRPSGLHFLSPGSGSAAASTRFLHSDHAGAGPGLPLFQTLARIIFFPAETLVEALIIGHGELPSFPYLDLPRPMAGSPYRAPLPVSTPESLSRLGHLLRHFCQGFQPIGPLRCELFHLAGVISHTYIWSAPRMILIRAFTLKQNYREHHCFFAQVRYLPLHF